MRLRPFHIFLLFLCAALPALEAKTADSDATLVVFNSRDPASAELAKYYAGKRNIPAEHVVGIDCPLTEEITREEYDGQIAEPLRKIMTDQGLWKAHVTIAGHTEVDENTIRFVALMRGIPLKIARTAKPYEGDKHD